MKSLLLAEENSNKTVCNKLVRALITLISRHLPWPCVIDRATDLVMWSTFISSPIFFKYHFLSTRQWCTPKIEIYANSSRKGRVLWWRTQKIIKTKFYRRSSYETRGWVFPYTPERRENGWWKQLAKEQSRYRSNYKKIPKQSPTRFLIWYRGDFQTGCCSIEILSGKKLQYG